jgi:hypothetical protein
MYKGLSNKTKLIIKIITILLLLIILIISILHGLGFRFNIDYTESKEETNTELSKDEKQEILFLFDSMSKSFLDIAEACQELDNNKLKIEIGKLVKINNKIQKTKLDEGVKNDLNKAICIWESIPSMIDDNVFDYSVLLQADMYLMEAIEKYNYIYGDDYEI